MKGRRHVAADPGANAAQRPAGPIPVIVSIPDQVVHAYRNGVRIRAHRGPIGASTCLTGKLGHRTPTGVFKILQKDKNHRSSTYNNAPMPNMNRLTSSGIALHAGQLPGYPASRGCVRLPKQSSELLFGVTKLGMTVVIADDVSQPEEVAHPGIALGEYAAREFNAVDASIRTAEYSEGHEVAPGSPSVVPSSVDKSITLFDSGALVARGKVISRTREGRWASASSLSPASTTRRTICAGRQAAGSLDCASDGGRPRRPWAAQRRGRELDDRRSLRGETASAIEAARAKGILTVEMEAAALHTYALTAGVRVLCLAHVTNAMAQAGDDFEKGEADGARDALTVLDAAIRALHKSCFSDEARPGFE